MSLLPWGGDEFLLAWQVHRQVEEAKKERLERRLVEDVMDRCGFKIMPVLKATEDRPLVSVLVNAEGQELTPIDKAKLEQVYQEVRAEYAERLRAEADREAALREAAAARRAAEEQAANDAAAAPYREARRLRFAKRQQKGTS